jgi:hypothetical protein
MKTKVVHCMREKYDVYIGRGSGFGNPYTHEKNTMGRYVGSREKAVEMYREYVLSHPGLIENIKSLKGKVLGCWCKTPESPNIPCHGDVIIEILEGNIDVEKT